jgi:hypothetical protein
MSQIDITSKIERLEAFEERLGISLENVSAFVDDDGSSSIPLQVCGEILTRNGSEIQEDIELSIAAYDPSGRVVGTASKCYRASSFSGLEIFKISTYLPVSSISKIRVYPKKN